MSDAAKQYCYRDYLKLPVDKRFEIINGTLYDMTPAPTVEHQKVLGKLHLKIANHLENKPCSVLLAPCDVLLPDYETEETESIKTIIQPDIFVVCDESKLQKKHCIGAPDLIVEILSPSTANRDRIEKSRIYYNHGVKEYWIADPDARTVEVLTPGEKYWQIDGAYSHEEMLYSLLFANLKINLADVFGSEGGTLSPEPIGKL
mgnify:CR=1 FL=1